MKLSIYDGRPYFYQYDTGQKIVIEDAPSDVNELHFTNSSINNAISIPIAEENGVKVCNVPNSLLVVSGIIKVYAYSNQDSADHTKETFRLTVLSRPKPSDYVEEEDLPKWSNLEGRIQKLEKGGGSEGAQIDEETLKQIQKNTNNINQLISKTTDLIINVTRVDGQYKIDKSWDEIQKAYIEGREIYCYAPMQSEYGSSMGNVPMVNFTIDQSAVFHTVEHNANYNFQITISINSDDTVKFNGSSYRYPNNTDNSLKTTDKSISGAINELYDSIGEAGWKLINEVALEEDAVKIEITEDINGNQLNFGNYSELLIILVLGNSFVADQTIARLCYGSKELYNLMHANTLFNSTSSNNKAFCHVLFNDFGFVSELHIQKGDYMWNSTGVYNYINKWGSYTHKELNGIVFTEIQFKAGAYIGIFGKEVTK